MDGRRGDYDMLGVPQDASLDEIRRSYRKLVLAWHPDRLGRADPELRARATRYVQELNAAYGRLTAPITWSPVPLGSKRRAASKLYDRAPRRRPVQYPRARRRGIPHSGLYRSASPLLLILALLAIVVLAILAPETGELPERRVDVLMIDSEQEQWRPSCPVGVTCAGYRTQIDRIIKPR